MRPTYLALAAAAALSLAACDSPADRAAKDKADAVEGQAQAKADAIESQADIAEEAGDEARADALEQKADAVEQAGEAQADQLAQEAGRHD